MHLESSCRRSATAGTTKSRGTLVPTDSAPPKGAGGGEQPKQSILAIASPDPRKNVELIYRAVTEEADRFPGGVSPRLDLICTSEGAARRAERDIERYGVKDARLLRDVDDAALAGAYAGAGAFVWPSWREGFGLPPLEAMRCGCPVAASEAPAMPEVLGGFAPVYFDPHSPALLAEAVVLLLSEGPEARGARVRAGQEWAAQYTCRRLANEMVAIWKSSVRGAGR
ncbi:MAG: glycosyltransferase [Cytophagales bacterium]|nr:glycosyltransferase [Armatimonadota bacterium]